MVEHIPIVDSVATVDPFGPMPMTDPLAYCLLHAYLASYN